MSGLEFRIADIEEDGEALLTSCALTVFADDLALWPVYGDDEANLEIQIDDLLSHLVEYWKPIRLRQTYPLGLNPAQPSDLAGQARLRWAEQPEEQAAFEDQLVETFLDCHELSRCFAGYFDLPPLWLVRSGGDMLVDTLSATTRVEYATAIAGLVDVGDWIAERLAPAGERWSDLIEAWRARDKGDSVTLLSWATGLEQNLARSLAEQGLLSSPQTLNDAANDNDELRLAARMASGLPEEEIRTVLSLVASFPKTAAPALDDLAASSRAHFDANLASSRPFEQGERLADFVRDRLALRDDQAVDIFGVVERLGAQIHIRDVESDTLDALAIAGSKHGPAVLLNTRTVYRKRGKFIEEGRARVTLAHELCHLLIDGSNALGAVDVLDGLMPPMVEQRAKAFAGQFLLPSRVAAREWLDVGAPRSRQGLKDLLDVLRERYVVSYSVADWKLEHGARAEGVDLHAMLKSIVPSR